MKVIISTLFVLCTAITVEGMRCWDCRNARSMEECNAKGHVAKCPHYQDTCETFVYRDGFLSESPQYRIHKKCRSASSCRQKQNRLIERKGSFVCNSFNEKSFCACCCQHENCNKNTSCDSNLVEQCTAKGGVCQMDNIPCRGAYLTGMCGGGANRRCCKVCPLLEYSSSHIKSSNDKPILVESGFEPHMDNMNRWAAECNVTMTVSRSYTPSIGIVQGGTVAPPSRRSNHDVGHAIDAVLVLPDGTLCKGACVEAKLFPETKCFVDKLESGGVSYGRDRADLVPIHLEDNLYNRNHDRWMTLYTDLQPVCRY